MAEQSFKQFRSKGEALIRKARLSPRSRSGRRSTGGFPWLEVQCSRCNTLEGALRCRKCAKAKWPPRGILHQLAPRQCKITVA